MASFNPKTYLIKLQGKEYLEVKWRLVWFREQHPTGAITTELVATDPTVIIRASIHGDDGTVLATGYGTSPAGGKANYSGRGVEKAETAAIGRALAHAGFGTQFDGDDDTDNLADAPVERPRGGNTQPASPAQPTPASAAPSGAVVNGWTQEQRANMSTELKALGVSVEEMLKVLNVDKLSDYAPGYHEASEALKAYAMARPASPKPLPPNLFGGNDEKPERSIR